MAIELARRQVWLKLLMFGLITAGLSGCEGASSDATATPARRATKTATAVTTSTTEAPPPTEDVPPTITLPPIPSPTQAPTQQATSTAQPTATPTLTPTPRPTRTPAPTTPPTPDLQALATQYPELGALMNNPEVAAAYKELLGAYMQNGQQGAMAVARQRGLLSPDGDILASLNMGSDDTASTVGQLQSLGIKVLSAQGSQINIAIPAALIMQGSQNPGALLNQLSALQNVLGVRPPGM